MTFLKYKFVPIYPLKRWLNSVWKQIFILKRNALSQVHSMKFLKDTFVQIYPLKQNSVWKQIFLLKRNVLSQVHSVSPWLTMHAVSLADQVKRSFQIYIGPKKSVWIWFQNWPTLHANSSFEKLMKFSWEQIFLLKRNALSQVHSVSPWLTMRAFSLAQIE